MLRGYGWLIASASLTAAAGLTACTGDEFLVGGGGNDGAGGATASNGPNGTGVSSSGTDVGSTGSTTSTGTGGCTGCMQDGTCVGGADVAACGVAGAVCQACSSDVLCQTASCNAGACGTTPANEGDPCPFTAGDENSGRCVAGLCEESPENCTNGMDDDEDTKVDCLDSDCNVAYTCVGNTPEGWDGPFAVYLGAVECPGAWGAATGTFGQHVDLSAGSYTCQCEATIAGCDDVSFVTDTAAVEDTCVTAPGDPTTIELGPAGCESMGETTALVYAHMADPDVPVTCAGAIDPDFQLPPVTYDQTWTVCDPGDVQGGLGCDAGACRPRAPDSGEVQGNICITRLAATSGSNPCPSPFTTRIIAESPIDTRGCDCDCSDPECGEIGFFDEGTCTTCDGNDGACASLGLDELCASDLPAADELFAGWTPTPQAETADDETGDLAVQLVTVCCLP